MGHMTLLLIRHSYFILFKTMLKPVEILEYLNVKSLPSVSQHLQNLFHYYDDDILENKLVSKKSCFSVSRPQNCSHQRQIVTYYFFKGIHSKAEVILKSNQATKKQASVAELMGEDQCALCLERSPKCPFTEGLNVTLFKTLPCICKTY